MSFGEFDTPMIPPQDFNIHDPGAELHWSDSNLNKNYSDKKDLEYKFFFKDNSTLPNQVSHELEEAVLMTVGGLALMIPAVGPALFAGSVVGAFMLQQYDKGLTGNGKDRLALLENDLFENQTKGRLNQVTGTIDTLKSLLGSLIKGHLFRHPDKDDVESIKTAIADLHKSNFAAGSASLLNMINTLKHDFKWKDNDIQQAMVVMLPFWLQCMEFEALLEANLSNLHRQRGEEKEANDQQAAFYNSMERISNLMSTTTKELRTWISQQKNIRRLELSTKIETGTTAQFDFSHKVSEFVKFHDGSKEPDSSQRTFSLEIVQMDLIQGGYDIGDAKKQMEKYMSEIMSWYKTQLDRHIDSHFTSLERVLDRCDTVAKAMDTQFGKMRQEKQHVNGVEMYNGMIREFKAFKQ